MGNESSKSDSDRQAKTATGVGIGAGLIVLSIVCPPAGAAATFATGTTGLGMKVVGSLSETEDMEEAGNVLLLGAEIGGAGNVTTRIAQGSHTPCNGCKSLPKVFK